MKAMSEKKRGIRLYPSLGKTLGQCLLSLLGGWIFAGAKIYGQALPLGACFVAAQALSLRTWAALAGALLGYFMGCEPAQAMEFSALTILMPVTRLLFQGTSLPEKKWFMPLCCGTIAGVLGAVRLIGVPELSTVFWLSKCLLGALCTDAFSRTFRGNPRARVIFAGALILGLSGKGQYINLGLLAAVMLSCSTESSSSRPDKP